MQSALCTVCSYLDNTHLKHEEQEMQAGGEHHGLVLRVAVPLQSESKQKQLCKSFILTSEFQFCTSVCMFFFP